MKKCLVLFLSLCMAFSLVSCGGNAVSESGDDLTVCFASEPSSIDPALNTAVDGAVMLNHSFEGLLKWVDDGNGNAILTGGMAENWDVSEDGTVYTFHIREGALWSDGKPVTANDFEYAWKRLVDPSTGAAYSYILDCILNGPEIIYYGTKTSDELGVKALNESTFEVTLHTAIPYFEEIASLPPTFPVRQDVIESNGDQWTFNPATYVGNGPYMMSEWVHNSYILMVQNPNYYGVENLGPNSIKFALMDDDNAMLAAFNSGELDFNEGYPIDEVPTLIESGQLKIGAYIGTYYTCFQTQSAPFDNPEVRKAFSLVIDRNYIVNQITRAGQVSAGGYVPSGINDTDGPGSDFREVGGNYYSISPEEYVANCETARALLAEAGYPGGENFPIVEYLYNTNDSNKMIAETLQNMWEKELGVQVTISNQDWAAFLDTGKSGNYSIACNSWVADYNDPISFLDMWVTEGGNNFAHYSNTEYDALIVNAKSSNNPAVRMQAMHDAEDILMGENVVAPIYFNTQPYMVADSLKGWYYSPLGYFFFSYASK